jgi:hypothetical protein
MATTFTVHKAERTKTPYLPRIGLVVELGGRKLTFKFAPQFESLQDLKLPPFAEKVAERAMAKVRTLRPKSKFQSARIVKKAQPKAASKKKDETAEV